MTRHQRILADVAAGRVATTCRGTPELIIDGRCCCDQSAGPLLAAAGWIRPLMSDPTGGPVPAMLTDAGRAALTE